MKHRLFAAVVVTFMSVVSVLDRAVAQEKDFGQVGTMEIAGGISFASITPVNSGKTGDAVTLLSLAPEFGYFVADGFEISLSPGMTLLPGLSVITPKTGNGVTILQLFASPSYNFHAEGSRLNPFVQASLGYSSESSGSLTQSGFSWGVKGGLKVVAVNHLLLTFYGQYLALSFNPENSTQRTGLDFLSFGIAVGGFF